MATPIHSICSVVLAAGRARRMGPDSPPKACIQVSGRTVLDHILSALESAGVQRHCIVVGDTEGSVRQAAGDRSGILYARQSVPRGTGDAVRCALDALGDAGIDDDLLVVAGDKVVDPDLISDLIHRHRDHDADLTFVVGDAASNPSSGRVILEADGRVAGIVEVADLRAAGSTTVTVGGITVDPATHDLSHTNQSVYLFRSEPLRDAARGLGSSNAQGEFYLTDTVESLVRAGRTVVACPQRSPDQVLSFNTPAELEHVRNRIGVGAATHGNSIRPVSEWLALLGTSGAASALRPWCGEAELPQALAGLRAALQRHLGAFGDLPAVIARAPGRANLMGRHIDHQGGHVNMMAIPRAAYVIASTSPGAGVVLVNTDPAHYPDRDFDIGPLPAQGQAWRTFVDSAPVRELSVQRKGDWSQYVRAAVVRIAAAAPVPGLRVTVHSDIPVAAGLSSSSAVVVATSRAVRELAGCPIADGELVEQCGEAEWFVGTRGGAGDHGAIVFSRADTVVQLSFLPFTHVGAAPFPRGYSLLLCHSGIHAGKTTNARDIFNQRVECYRMGREIIRGQHPDLADRIVHLRDMRADNLDGSTGDVVRLLAALPEWATRADLANLLPADTPGPDPASPEPFPIRGVVLFGLAECERARRSADVLAAGDTATLGRWMVASHDGDRVAWRNGTVPPAWGSAELNRVAAHADRAPSALCEVPGGYACSTSEVDSMVDIALASPGVAGAQIAGAGLGGCMMVLVRTDMAEATAAALVEGYYGPRNVEPVLFHCTPAPGSSLLRI